MADFDFLYRTGDIHTAAIKNTDKLLYGEAPLLMGTKNVFEAVKAWQKQGPEWN